MLQKTRLVLAVESTEVLRSRFPQAICEKVTEQSFLLGESSSRVSITPQYVARRFAIIKMIVCEHLIEG